MAERRMFAKTIVLSDAFLDMPLGARCLYMTMGMLADDDGFVNAPKSIMRQCGASDDDLRVLISKKFVIPFESGVIVIKHWRINNYLQKDRTQPTKYIDEYATLTIDENGAYTQPCIHDCVYIDKNSIDKNSIDKIRVEESVDGGKKPPAHARGEYGWVKLTDEQYGKLLADLGEEELARCIRYIDEAAQQTGNKNKWKDWNLIIRKCSRDGWGKGTSRQPATTQKKYVTAEEYKANPPKPNMTLDDLRRAIDSI